MLIDIHCHLDMCRNPSDCVKRAIDAGVGIIVTNGVNHQNNMQVLELARMFPIVKAALGLYPIDALSMSDEDIIETIKFIRKNESKVVAIGEVGIDYKEDLNQHERQKKTFAKMIDLALELDKPIVVHSRKAELDAIEMLEETGIKKVLMHCFSGNMKLVKRIIDNGWFLSIPTAVKHATHFQEVIKLAPVTQLLCETDAPYLHPDKERDNESKNIVESYKKIAEIKKISLKEVEKQVEDNYNVLFGN